METLRQRFDEKWIGEPNSGCWLWTAALNPAGYGTFSVGTNAARPHCKLAHRVAWMLYVAPIPEGRVVCHRCDNPSCVNPAHLFLGTHAENVADKCSKRRHARGNGHGRRKLSHDDVERIRVLLSQGVKQAVLTARFGVTQSVISRIKNRSLWNEQ